MLLGWEQGTGKTIVSLAAAEKLFDLEKAQRALVLAPTSIAWQWEDKIHEFTTSNCALVESKQRALREYDISLDYSYWIVPYSIFRRDYTYIFNRPFDLVIADEAQEFKNNRSKTYKLMLALNRAINPTYRWALTGTAISRKLEELYRIFYWVDKRFLPPWPVFEENHIIRSELTNQITAYKNLKSLNRLLPQRFDRKKLSDFEGQMPKLVERVHRIEQTDQYKEAERHLMDVLEDLVQDIEFDDEGALKGFAPSSEVSQAFHACRKAVIPESKLQYVINLDREILDENSENRHIIFCFYKHPLYTLHGECNGHLFTGDQSGPQKRTNVHRFEQGDGGRTLLASNAGSTGLDLPFARYLTNLDVPFTWGIRDQRNRRIVRASSKYRTAVANSVIMKDSIEEFYYLVVRNLERLANATYEGVEDEIKIKPSSLRQWLKDKHKDE